MRSGGACGTVRGFRAVTIAEARCDRCENSVFSTYGSRTIHAAAQPESEVSLDCFLRSCVMDAVVSCIGLRVCVCARVMDILMSCVLYISLLRNVHTV